MLYHLIPNDKHESFHDYIRLFYTEQDKIRGQDIGKLIKPDLPNTFKYFMEEFEHRRLFMNFETLENILNSISLTDDQKI